ncbi:MAG: Vgb family protein, partial [Acidimicrobiales bacterium]
YGITAGPDGNLWFTENGGDKVGRITPAGAITEYPLPTANSGPDGITAGPDGNVWFTENGGNNIGKLQTPSAGVQATSVTVTPGVLSVALANPTVPFGSLTPGTTSAAAQVGTITYTDTLGDTNGWTATVAATDLVDLAAGTNPPTAIGAANLRYTPGATIIQTATNQAVAGSAGSFAFATACPDLSPAVSFTCPLAVATAGAGAGAQGTFNQTNGSVVLTVPVRQATGSYSGLLQYTLTN